MALDPTISLAELARSRRLELEAWAAYPAPFELGIRPLEPLRLYSPDARRMAGYCGAWVADDDTLSPWERAGVRAEPNCLRGQAGSAGVVRGRARIIFSLAESGRLEKGDILVTTTTAPPWTPLFLTAGGLVTDAGGLLSHGAVVSREYRLPAVVGASGATTAIQDGQWIEVDGTNGIVRIL
jgi:phosphohistidine swiveling domain-containing protein